MTRIKGLELLFSAIQKDLVSKEDCIVAALHCILINADLLCVGNGEVFSQNDSDSVTELLPEKWNENQDVYCLRYRDKDFKHCYLLKVVRAGCSLHVDLVLDEKTSSGMTVNTENYVSDDYSKFSHAFKNLDELRDNFLKEILNNVSVNENKTSANENKKPPKQETPQRNPEPLRSTVPIPRNPPIPSGVPDSRYGPSPYEFPRIGGSDLDPLGRNQGSMLFDPLRSGLPSRPGRGLGPDGLPPHAVPPGARFDPFSPITPNRFDPNPDHFRPPDYDNMYL